MNCLNAKLGDRFLLKVNSKTYCTDMTAHDMTMPATIIGFYMLLSGTPRSVLIGWCAKDGIRPNDSDPLHRLDSASKFVYVDNIKEYTFGAWKFAGAEFVASFLNTPIVSSEWKCKLPGCQKPNDAVAKTCWNCGRDINGRE